MTADLLLVWTAIMKIGIIEHGNIDHDYGKHKVIL